MTINAAESHEGVDRTSLPFAEAASEILRARQIAVRQLARDVDASPSHISRILRGAQKKQPSVDLVRRVTAVLELPADYFREVRCARVTLELGRDPALVDEVYARCPRKDLP